ncbi:methyltransferase domain-containing protein [Coleofasciculus sp. E2-BRE-01]|uniref:methyltransferase domain-containing protein n=1 Tax=Coleofasciculus sp. E2-BRE-01 TaxID=3069524 RepID=UPI0032F84ED3
MNIIIKAAKKIKHKLKNKWQETPSYFFSLTPELPLPKGVSEDEIRKYLKSVLVADAPPQEMANYCDQDFRRFVYTYGLAQDISGKCLELGANPYFTTLLLKEFTRLELVLANYFGSNITDLVQNVNYKDFYTGKQCSTELKSFHFNIEGDLFPFKDEEFDVVLFCEIIEHLLIDPVAVIQEIKRVLKPNGVLILTTPNVSRLENVSKMIAGANIYDPYSGYGYYGRHNREYNKHELQLLLNYMGFTIESMFTADVHENHANHYCSIAQLESLLKHRELDLGQYIFVRAINQQKARTKKPAFLYRSYPDDQLE